MTDSHPTEDFLDAYRRDLSKQIEENKKKTGKKKPLTRRPCCR